MQIMDHNPVYSILNRLLDPITQCLTPEAARKLVDLRADAAVQNRVDELADKSTAGSLTAEEKSEYETYITANTLIGILQSKAHKILSTQTVA
jgi:hypothetical protein